MTDTTALSTGPLSGDRRLSIEARCRCMIGAYAFLADHRRYDEQAALFAEDGVYENPFTKAEGRHAIRAYLNTRPVGGQTFFETVTPDEVVSITYVTVFGAPGTDEGPNDMAVGGSVCEFHNRFRREAGDWRITYHNSKGVMVLKN